MPLTFLKIIGSFFRWLVKGFKSNLLKEIDGEYEATWGKSYDFENYIIGIFAAIVIMLSATVIVYYNVR
jgi:hypothetical protein